MAYYTKVLQPGENVKYVGRLHWMIYRHSIAFSMLMAVAAYVTVSQFENSESQRSILLVFLLLAVISFLYPWFVRATTEIVVTDKRIIHKVGWIARQTKEMNMTKVETVEVEQGFVGRILGFGTVLIIGIGASWEPLVYVASPLELRNAIMVG